MRYLNLGCGYHFSQEDAWTNVDFSSTGPGVLAHNLRNGIPFPDQSFDVVYHSHVLEHFPKKDGEEFIKECSRVLKQGGILRCVVPDLEQIARTYIMCLEKGLETPASIKLKADYDWIMLELYDQAVRDFHGGEMARYLFQGTLINEDFVYKRVGEEGRAIRESYLKSPVKKQQSRISFKRIINSLLRRMNLVRTLRKESIVMENLGRFHTGGEIHKWMYDRYSLGWLLEGSGFTAVKVRTAFESYMPGWETFNLDGIDGIVRKPDSLFIEAVKG